MAKQNTASGSIGFGSLLTILFIALKLLGVINWSWWWVLAPIWLPIVVFFVVMFLFLVIAALAGK